MPQWNVLIPKPDIFAKTRNEHKILWPRDTRTNKALVLYTSTYCRFLVIYETIRLHARHKIVETWQIHADIRFFTTGWHRVVI